TPIFVGTCAQDPSLDVDAHLARVKEYGLAGVVNFPSVSFFEGRYRNALEDAGIGLDREAAMLRRAKELGRLTTGFRLRSAGATGVDILCVNRGLAEGGPVDAAEPQAALDRAIESIRSMMDAAQAAAPSPYCVIFGGPVLLPQDTAQVYQRTEALGYLGGSAV